MGYALDRLGWLHFEQLCAALLELEGGVAPLAWAGGADRCRGVLSGTALQRPLVASALPAPVLVQCAWVRNGSDEDLIAAVREFIADRDDDLALAASFVLLTNLDVSSGLRNALQQELPGDRVRVRVLGLAELGSRLDARAELRRAMPSVLGVCDLSGLIDADVRERSSLDVDGAAALAAVFVPTRAYRRALGVLGAHRFAVLTGPPEMGKTAIARMIALAQMTDGWEAHECVKPEDVWSAFDPVDEKPERLTEFTVDDARRALARIGALVPSLGALVRSTDHVLTIRYRITPGPSAIRRPRRPHEPLREDPPGQRLFDVARVLDDL
jgi:hypothetical protein